MPDAPTPNRTRLAAAAGLLGASAVAALVLGAGPAPSVLQLAGASDDVAGDISGNCDEAEHANDPECAGTSADRRRLHQHDRRRGTTSTTVDATTSTTAGGRRDRPDRRVRSLDAAGAGTVIYAVEGGSLRLGQRHAGQRLAGRGRAGRRPRGRARLPLRHQARAGERRDRGRPGP